MKKIRLIIVAIVLTVTAFGGGLLVNAALSTPSNANASTSRLAAVNADTNPAYDAAASVPDDTSMADMANAMNAMGMSQAMPDFGKAGGPTIAPSKGPEAGGVISTTTATSGGYTITLKGTNRTVTLNSSTTVGDSNGTLNASDLKAGDFIFALGTAQSDGSLTARWVLRLPAPPQAKTGTVSSVNAAGNSFQFTTTDKVTWTVNVSSSTRLAKNGQAITLSDIAVNDRVVVLGTVDTNAHTIAATDVTDGVPNRPNPGNATAGTVSSIDTTNNSFVITPTAFAIGRGSKNQTQPSSNNNSPVTVTVDSNTRFVGANLKSLSDLKAGDKIIVTGDKQSDGSIKATTVARVPATFQRKPGNNNGNQRGSNSQNNNTSSNTGSV